MLSKVEKMILKTCYSENNSEIRLFKLYNDMKNKPKSNEYLAAIRSLKEKGYFDNYDEQRNEIIVTLSTKGFNFKTDEVISLIKYLFEYAVLPILIGAISSIITNFII